MNVFTILEILTVLLLTVLFITQILVPLFRGRPLFPMFKRESKLLKEKEEVLQQRDEKRLSEEISKEKSKL